MAPTTDTTSASGPLAATSDRSALERMWPPARIRVRTPRLELRMPTDADLEQLAALAIDGVHDPREMPFSQPWTDSPPADLARGLYQWHWSSRGSWAPSRWRLLLAAYSDGEAVGCQDVSGTSFALRRTAVTGSWLGRRFHGRGLGTEMRQAVLALAFEGFGADVAMSDAWEDNPASIRVSEKCGYERNGVDLDVRRRGGLAPDDQPDRAVAMVAFRLTRAAWLERRRDDIEVVGVDEDVLTAIGATGGRPE